MKSTPRILTLLPLSAISLLLFACFVAAIVLPNLQGAAAAKYLKRKSVSALPINNALTTSEMKLTAFDGGVQADAFGAAAAIDGDTLIFGAYAPAEGVPGATRPGAAYVFRRVGQTWMPEAMLSPAGLGNDHFGVSASISGDTAVIGNRLDDDFGQNTGSAFVFRRNGSTWTQEAHLFADSTGHAGLAEFGRTVSIDGDTIVVGNPRDDDNGSLSGSAYVFQRSGTTWAQEAKLIGNDTVGHNEFGHAVAVSGDTIVVGAIIADAQGADSGAAYVFRRNGTTWTQEAKLIGNDTIASDGLGSAVAINGDRVVIAAYHHDSAANDAGAAYVFRRSGTTWTQEAKLTASDAAAEDSFGNAVSISGDAILVGAFVDDEGSLSNSGSAYVFRRNGVTWSEVAKLKASDAAMDDLFGASVATDGESFLVGAYLADTAGGVNAGAGYVFKLSSGTPPAISAIGVMPQVGSPSANLQIATTSDAEDAAEILQVQISSDGISFGNTATLTGVTVTLTDSNASAAGSNPNATGQVFADVVAACGASNASFTVKVTDSSGDMGTAMLAVNVTANSVPTLTYNVATVATGGAANVSPATATDNGSITGYSIVSVVPPLNVAPTVNSSGVVAITSAGPGGDHVITVQATDNCGATTDASFTLTVNCPAISINPSSLPDGTVGAGYSQTITPSGGASLYTFSFTGTLPNGLTLSSGPAATATLSGTPNAGGISNFTVTATDANGCAGAVNYFLYVETGVCAAVQPNSVAWWRGNGNANDSVGSNHGTLQNGAAFALGRVGQAFSFNGAGDYVALPASSVYPSGNSPRTVDMWVYTRDLSSWGSEQTIFEYGAEPGTRTAFGIDMDGYQMIQFYTWGDDLDHISTGPKPATGWMHIAVTYDGLNLHVYTDGVLRGSRTYPTGLNTTPSDDAVIGRSNNLFTCCGAANTSFDGLIDEVEIYDRALSAAEIQAIFQAGSAGKCANLPPQITGATLAQQQGSPASAQQIATVSDPDQAANSLTMVVTPLTGMGVTIGTPAIDASGNALASVQADCTATNSTFEVKVTDANGAMATGTLTVNVSANAAPMLGNYPAAVVIAGGNAAVTPDTVPADNGVVATLTASAPGFTGTFSGNLSTGVITIKTAGPLGIYNVTVTATDNCGATFTRGFALHVETGACATLPSNAVAWYGGDGNANDTAGSNHGTTQNGASFAAGKVGQAFSFDGVNDFVQAPDSNLWAFGAQDFTIELWANFASVHSPSTVGDPAVIFVGNDEGGGNLNKWSFALGGGVLNFHINDPALGPEFLAQTPFTPVLGQWYHLAVRRSGNTYTIFVNGQPGNSEVNTRAIADANAPLTIGQAESLGFMHGLLDEISIYHRALSDTELQGIAAAGSSGKCPPATCPAITINPPNLPGGQAGMAYSQAITALPTAGYTFAQTGGTLPNGLTLASNGALSGVPLQTGSFSFTVTATTAAFGMPDCNGSRTYTLFIACPAVAVSPTNLPGAMVNTAYNQTLTAGPSGGNYTFAVTGGAIPTGLALLSNGSFSGAPAQMGTFNFRIAASGWGGSGSCTGFRDYTLVVACASITVNPTNFPGGTVGTAYNQNVSAAPAGTYSYRVTSGALPPGLALDAATSAITGTPINPGLFTFTISAAAGACSGSRTYTVEITCQGVSITPASLPAATAGSFYSQTISVSPAGNYTFSLAQGNLPSGLTLHPATGVISGLPAVVGTVSFIVKVHAPNSCSTTQAYTLTTNCPPAVTLSPASLPSGAMGTAYSQTLSASPAGGNYMYTVTSGSLPARLTLNSATGLLSGTPTANGSFTFTATATGFGSCAGSKSYTVVIGSGGCPAITLPASLPAGSTGQFYSSSVAALPSGSYSYTFTGSLPPGVTLYNSLGILLGYPTANGTYNFTVTATGANNCSASQSYSVVIGAGSLQVVNDFSGDQRSDFVLWRAAQRQWLIVDGATNAAQTVQWGQAGDRAVTGDYDGDGKADLAGFGKDGHWRVRLSGGGTLDEVWGLGSDIPVPGDYDGDGKTDLAVWRGAESGWYIQRSSDGQTESTQWGTSLAPYLDVPVPGDYDGDGQTDIAVFRQANGHWYIRRSSDGRTVDKAWGLGSDVPVPGDYDGDGQTDFAVWRGSQGDWHIVRSSDGAVESKFWGAAYEPYFDVPVVGDYDGDGKADVAVWRKSEGRWYVQQSSDGRTRAVTQGQVGDKVVTTTPRQ